MEENKGMGNNKAQNYDSGDIMEATNVQSSKSTNEVPNLEEAHDENKEGGSKVEKDKRKRKAADETTSTNPEPSDEVDNASSNDVAISYLKSRMEDWNTYPLKGEHMHVRCCAHILNLVVQDGLKEWNSSISKIRNAIRYVRASPGHMDKFRRCIKEARLRDKSIVQLDVPTRWNSTYLMLESSLKFQKEFKRLEEKCVEYVMLQGGIPNNEDWETARCHVKFLKIFFDITEKVSGMKYVTSSQYFNEHVLALITFKKMRDSGDLMLGMMAEKMKVKYDKYWGNVKNMNMLIFVAAVLDPRNKFRFVEWGMNKIYEKDIAEFMSQKVKEELHEMFEKYRFFANQGQLATCVQSSNEKRMINIDSIDDELAAEFEKDMDLHENLNKNEVDLYLMEALEKKNNPNFDILNWWKVNSTKYLILGQLARDILAIPVSHGGFDLHPKLVSILPNIN
ncbi:hypothetical protein F3Y22_tig00111164pilonHSYRG00067 [Hibiscus syriacus]|uniref:hAT-like transposase RNase-H fold domain-containing protein n=1 Tax=Hibiscus syriacus TaxID=106335 RepID=A0A6A2YYH0_HIBSY|nr:hypothetical protein F3Y22_tig00111164pilonHSYRG00067 [Hibiscus syriacus]